MSIVRDNSTGLDNAMRLIERPDGVRDVTQNMLNVGEVEHVVREVEREDVANEELKVMRHVAAFSARSAVIVAGDRKIWVSGRIYRMRYEAELCAPALWAQDGLVMAGNILLVLLSHEVRVRPSSDNM